MIWPNVILLCIFLLGDIQMNVSFFWLSFFLCCSLDLHYDKCHLAKCLGAHWRCYVINADVIKAGRLEKSYLSMFWLSIQKSENNENFSSSCSGSGELQFSLEKTFFSRQTWSGLIGSLLNPSIKSNFSLKWVSQTHVLAKIQLTHFC
jgi:hypothetical protein